jgi:RNA polymerase sigma-70 factor (ECF subfamily)
VSTYEDPEAWVRTVAVRLLISRLRRAKVARLGLQRLAARTRSATQESEPFVNTDFEAAVRRLAPGQRAAVLLHYAYDMTLEQVADVLNVAVGTVKSRLSRARAVLAPLLTDEEVADRA